MGLFGNYNNPGPGIPKDQPPKKGLALFFDILGREFFELMKLNLLFLLFCIPLITIPAAITAMSRITLTMVRDENHFLWYDFTRSFRREFKNATFVGLFMGLFFLAGGFALRFYWIMAEQSLIFLVLFFLIAAALVFLLLGSVYLFRLIALVELPLRQQVKNAWLLALVCLPRSVLAVVLSGALALLCLLYFPLTLPYLILLGFALSSLVVSQCSYPAIRRYILQQGESGVSEEKKNL